LSWEDVLKWQVIAPSHWAEYPQRPPLLDNRPPSPDWTSVMDVVEELLSKEGGAADFEKIFEAVEDKTTYIVSRKEVKAILENNPNVSKLEDGDYILVNTIEKSWGGVLKIRQEGPDAKEGKRLRERFESSIKPKSQFSFRGNYTYDELYNLLDQDIKNKLERFLKKGRNLLTQEYRLLMASKREKREFASSGKMPTPFTMDDIKDKVTIKLKDDPKGNQSPTYNYINEKIEIILPITKRPVVNDSQKALGNALDELYKKFVKNNKEKPKKWYQEYRRTGKKVESLFGPHEFERPDFDADEEDIEYFKKQIMDHVFTHLTKEQIRSGADPNERRGL
jgi:hypothetical protein